jgi:hypothetical protein
MHVPLIEENEIHDLTVEYIFLVTFKSCNIVIKFRLLLVKPAKLLSQACRRIVG